MFEYFPEVKGFRLVRKEDNVVIYERFYENLRHFLPLKNKTTGEIERCVIRIEVGEEKDGKRSLGISLFRHFPAGTDYGNHNISNPNMKKGFSPIDFASSDKYFINEWTGEFLKFKKNIGLERLLNQLYSAHIRQTKKFKGLMSRLLGRIVGQYQNIINAAIRTIEFFMKYACGKIFANVTVRQEFLLEAFSKDQIKIRDESPIKFTQGYECSKTVAFVSSLILIGIAYLNRDNIVKVPAIAIFLAIPVWIVVLFTLDIIMPNICLLLINILIRARDSQVISKIWI